MRRSRMAIVLFGAMAMLIGTTVSLGAMHHGVEVRDRSTGYLYRLGPESLKSDDGALLILANHLALSEGTYVLQARQEGGEGPQAVVLWANEVTVDGEVVVDVRSRGEAKDGKAPGAGDFYLLADEIHWAEGATLRVRAGGQAGGTGYEWSGETRQFRRADLIRPEISEQLQRIWIPVRPQLDEERKEVRPDHRRIQPRPRHLVPVPRDREEGDRPSRGPGRGESRDDPRRGDRQRADALPRHRVVTAAMRSEDRSDPPDAGGTGPLRLSPEVRRTFEGIREINVPDAEIRAVVDGGDGGTVVVRAKEHHLSHGAFVETVKCGDIGTSEALESRLVIDVEGGEGSRHVRLVVEERRLRAEPVGEQGEPGQRGDDIIACLSASGHGEVPAEVCGRMIEALGDLETAAAQLDNPLEKQQMVARLRYFPPLEGVCRTRRHEATQMFREIRDALPSTAHVSRVPLPSQFDRMACFSIMTPQGAQSELSPTLALVEVEEGAGAHRLGTALVSADGIYMTLGFHVRLVVDELDRYEVNEALAAAEHPGLTDDAAGIWTYHTPRLWLGGDDGWIEAYEVRQIGQTQRLHVTLKLQHGGIGVVLQKLRTAGALLELGYEYRLGPESRTLSDTTIVVPLTLAQTTRPMLEYEHGALRNRGVRGVDVDYYLAGAVPQLIGSAESLHIPAGEEVELPLSPGLDPDLVTVPPGAVRQVFDSQSVHSLDPQFRVYNPTGKQTLFPVEVTSVFHGTHDDYGEFLKASDVFLHYRETGPDGRKIEGRSEGFTLGPLGTAGEVKVITRQMAGSLEWWVEGFAMYRDGHHVHPVRFRTEAGTNLSITLAEWLLIPPDSDDER